MRKRTCHCKHEDLNPTTPPLCGKPGTAMPTCTPRVMSVVRQEAPLGLAGRLPSSRLHEKPSQGSQVGCGTVEHLKYPPGLCT